MALTRFASALLVSALAAGCNQSLFDARLGGDDPAGDGGPLAPDARPGGRDGGDDRDGAPPVRPDARVGDAGGVDGSGPMPPDKCPEPCAGDAYRDFNGTATGASGRWRYVEVTSSFEYIEMISMTPPGAAGGWIGTSTPPPSIAYCTMTGDQLPCGDQAEALVFTNTTMINGPYPGVRWIAPADGDYQLRIDWAFPSLASRVGITWYLILGQSSVLDEFRTEAMASGSFETSLSLSEGAIITLASFAETNTSTSLAVNFYITGPLSTAGFQGVQP